MTASEVCFLDAFSADVLTFFGCWNDLCLVVTKFVSFTHELVAKICVEIKIRGGVYNDGQVKI
jgi:hypothetical protein